MKEIRWGEGQFISVLFPFADLLSKSLVVGSRQISQNIYLLRGLCFTVGVEAVGREDSLRLDGLLYLSLSASLLSGPDVSLALLLLNLWCPQEQLFFSPCNGPTAVTVYLGQHGRRTKHSLKVSPDITLLVLRGCCLLAIRSQSLFISWGFLIVCTMVFQFVLFHLLLRRPGKGRNAQLNFSKLHTPSSVLPILLSFLYF